MRAPQYHVTIYILPGPSNSATIVCYFLEIVVFVDQNLLYAETVLSAAKRPGVRELPRARASDLGYPPRPTETIPYTHTLHVCHIYAYIDRRGEPIRVRAPPGGFRPTSREHVGLFFAVLKGEHTQLRV